MSKHVTQSQILGEQGIALIQRRVLEMGFLWHGSTGTLEAGIDGWIELRDRRTGEVANCWIAVQSRARSKLEGETDESVWYTCPEKDFEYWMSGSAPVLLILSRPGTDDAWWVSIKDYFCNKDTRRDRRVRFDKARDRFDDSAASRLESLGSKYGAGAYFTPLPRQETLLSNLLAVSRMPGRVCQAETHYRDPAELQAKLRELCDWPPGEWMLKDGMIYCLHNLGTDPWRRVCDTKTVTTLETQSWSNAESADLRRNLVRLLNQCLRTIVGRWGMRYSKEQDCYYFKPTRDLSPRKVRYHAHSRVTTRTVFRGYESRKDPNRVAYYRHDAFEHRYRRYALRWYLEISPTYVFTRDGQETDPYREERLAKIKTIEGDAAVAGRVLMFAHMLRDEATLFDEPYPFLGFGKLETVSIPVGIDDDAWARIKAGVGRPDAIAESRHEPGSQQPTLF